ncbi:MAG: hypothetical protein K1W22_13090 [Lachnospiraceae bacterium]
MDRTFHTDGCCDPKLHYMVDLTTRLEEICVMVDAGKYFTINRASRFSCGYEFLGEGYRRYA